MTLIPPTATRTDTLSPYTTLFRSLKGTRARVHLIPFGDIWLLDTGPIFVTGEGRLTAVDFGFNGWGGKYEMANDDTVGADIARATATPLRVCDWLSPHGIKWTLARVPFSAATASRPDLPLAPSAANTPPFDPPSNARNTTP